jgi:hypothetical protein
MPVHEVFAAGEIAAAIAAPLCSTPLKAML